MNNLENAINDWQTILTPENVRFSKDEVDRFNQNTFNTTKKVVGSISPSSTKEVSKCLKVANRFGISVYPISGGINWGFGSKISAQNNCVILDLNRLNQIYDYNETFGTITVGPGVSFQDCFDFLEKKKSNYFINVIGGPPQASVIGNICERGDGIGPHSERINFISDFEIVLPKGNIINTGFSKVENSKVARLFPYGIGPSPDGLFLQSNLGIITKMTIWLSKKPVHFELGQFQTNNDSQLASTINSLRECYLSNTLNSPTYILNDYKQLAGIIQFPFSEIAKGPLVESHMKKYRRSYKFSKWNGIIPIYSQSALLSKAKKKIIGQGISSSIRFFNSKTYTMVKRFKSIAKKVIPNPQFILELWKNNPFLGNPHMITYKSLFWRKQEHPPKDFDANVEKCGLYWQCFILPFCGKTVVEISSKLTEITLSQGFEPNIAIFLSPSGRYIRVFLALIFDQANDLESQRADECNQSLHIFLEDNGYTHNRVNIDSMDSINVSASYKQFINELKKFFDPNLILAPNRYEF